MFYFDRKFNSQLSQCKHFLSNNKHLINKGQITFLMNTQNDIDKMLNSLKNFKHFNRNFLNKIDNDLENLIKSYKSKLYIDDDLHNYLKCPFNNANLTACYKLSKIHKTKNPDRILNSSIDSPTYKLVK